MTCLNATKSKRRLSAKLAAGLVVSAVIALGPFAAPADAGDRNGHHRGHKHSWNGGYYRAPPVVYGSSYGSSSYYGTPYNYYPPVVYGPSIGIGLPGISIGIR
jgi:hypothetical protein